MGLFGKKEEFAINSVINGETRKLKTLKDGVFSELMLGDGVVVCAPNTSSMDVVAPFAGEVVVAFPTGHAYGIKASNGVEVLVHIGVDTVNLGGKGFKPHVKQGQRIKKGDKLVTVDLDYVRMNAPTADVVVIVTSGQKVVNQTKGCVTHNDKLFDVE